MPTSSEACTLIGSGSVGEPGPFVIVSHIISGPTQKIIIVKHASSDLCPNTGASAFILIDGTLAASGSITHLHSSVQTSALPGSLITILIHTFPLNNGVICFRLGRLNFTAEECELVTRTSAVSFAPCSRESPKTPTAFSPIPVTTDWYAWNNLMPTGPVNFHLRGKIYFLRPGMDASLIPRIPQGINPRILLIDLTLSNSPGQTLLSKPLSFDSTNAAYDTVEVYFEGHLLISIPVENIF